MGLIISVLFGKALQAIFFGRLRAIEIEVLDTETRHTHIQDVVTHVKHSIISIYMKGLGMQ